KVQILAFSAETRDKLEDGLTAFGDSLSSSGLTTSDGWDRLRYAASCLRAEFRVDHAERLLMVVERDRTDFARLIANSRTMLQKHSEVGSWSTPDGIFFGSGPAIGKLAFVFPGQGSQYVGMLRDLACQFPRMQEALAEANDAWHGKPLTDFIYPRPEFSETA